MNKTTSSVLGPEESWDPLTFLDKETLNEIIVSKIRSSNFEEQSLLNEGQKMNLDGPDDQLSKQNIFLKTDCVSEASGSSYIEIGNTKLLVSVYGPREIARKEEYDFKISNLNVEFRFASFSCFMQRRATLNQRDQALDEKNYSTIVEEGLKPSILLHKYPKSQIDLYILCLQNDIDSKNIISASMIASSLALSNASIELYDLVSSYTNIPYSLSVSYMPLLHQVTSIFFSNENNGASISSDLFKSYVKECIENCKKIYSYMKLVLLNSNNNQINNSEI